LKKEMAEIVEKTVGGVLLELSQLDPDILLTLMNAKMNLQARVITEALAEIDLFRMDVHHHGSIASLYEVERVLKEATGQ
jgi:hypothetical protein